MWILVTTLPDHTWALGAVLGEVIGESLVVALVGDLGSGKTCFAQGVGAGLSIEEEILSPTFGLIHEYDGRSPLLHADVYRLEPGELEAVGLEEQLESWPGLALVEWGDRFPEIMPGDHLRVSIEDMGGSCRRLCLEASGPCSERILSKIQTAWELRDR